MKYIICCISAVLVLAGCSHNPPKPSGDWYYVNPAPTAIISKSTDNKSDNQTKPETKSVSDKSE